MRVPAAALIEALRRKPVIEDLWEESSLKDALRILAEERAEARGEARSEARGIRESIEMVLVSRLAPLARTRWRRLPPPTCRR